MSGRELVILLLGLAIVAVVLRGLYVALNARRGQIKLAIDKNIPQNVDLEALEMAELPGGGARVVTRSLEEVNRQNSALDKAENKAKTIRLADDDDEGIPVLMDAVELAPSTADHGADPEPPNQWQEPEETFSDIVEESLEPQNIEMPQMPQPEEIPEELEAIAEEEFSSHDDTVPSIGDDWEEDESVSSESESDFVSATPSITPPHQADDGEATTAEDADAILLDYDEEDGPAQAHEDPLSAVAPDYDDERDMEDEQDFEDEEVGLSTNYVSAYEESYADELQEQEFDDGGEIEELEREEGSAEESHSQSAAERDEMPAAFDADHEADEFSMTAGERIGGNPPRLSEAKQSGLFDDDAGATQEEEEPRRAKKNRSLFGMFGRKSKPAAQSEDSDVLSEEQQTDSASDEPAYGESPSIEEAIEVPATIHEQTEIPEVEEVEIVDELDQKRAESEEQHAQTEDAQAEEFEQSEVLVLNVTARDGRVFAGDDLLHILITSGLKFGDMNIFHKRITKDYQGAVIFSVANMLNPGTFDLNNMDEFTTLGISFFLALPTPINNLDAFEQMLGVAQDIRDTLDGDLKDDHRNGMTAQTIEHYRQRIRDFELRRLKAVAARG